MVVERLHNIDSELREKNKKYDDLRSELERTTEVYVYSW